MQIDTGIIVGMLCGLGVWLFLRWRSPRPEFPPLHVSPDDPLMVEALAKAKGSLAQFLSLARASGEHGLVKVDFVSSSDQTEHLWAEVLEIFSDTELGIRLVTPPVTHSGQLDRVYRCNTEDIQDWQVRDSNGKIHGGFTQKAMFAIARRDGIKLPKRLLEHEEEYADT